MDSIERQLESLSNKLDTVVENQAKFEVRLSITEKKAEQVPELDKRLSIIEERLGNIHQSLVDNVLANTAGFNNLKTTIDKLSDELSTLKIAEDKKIADNARSLKKSLIEKIISWAIPIIASAVLAYIIKGGI